MNSLKKTFAAAIAVALAVGAQAAEDSLMVTTLNPASGATDCTKNNFGYALNERAAVVRGTPHHKIRIERNLVDVNLLDDVDVESCGGHCKAKVTRKGNFDSGNNGNLIDRKGFVELDFHAPVEAPTGNATLVLKYLGGGRGEYKLLIVRNSRVDSVQRTTEGGSVERYVLNGNNLHLIRNAFSAHGPNGGLPLTRVSEADEKLVLDRNARNCTTVTATLDLTLEAATACRIKDVRLPVTRDESCGSGSTPPPPVPTPPASPPPRSTQPSAPNLLPALATPTVLTRPLGAAVITTRGSMFPVNSFFCSRLAANTPTTVDVPKLTWGVSGVNIESATGAAARFDVQLLDADANRILDTLTLPQGFPSNTPLVQRDNYPGRASTIRVVMNPRFQEGSALRTFAGCFTEPGSTQTLDPKTLLVKVDPDNRIIESNENDNELRF
jgi:hypothetical protein